MIGEARDVDRLQRVESVLRDYQGALLLMATWLLISAGIASDFGMYGGLLATTLAGIPFILLILAGGLDPDVRSLRRMLLAVLIFCLLASLLRYRPNAAPTAAPLVTVTCVLAATLALVTGIRSRSRWLHLALAIAATASMVTAIRRAPRPIIDVWFILQSGADEVLHGRNMFHNCLPLKDSTDPATQCVYPYFPGTSVLEAPFKLVFNDVRYAYVVAILVAAVCVYRLARPELAAPLAALMFVFPHFQFGIEQAWNEPLIIAAVACMVLAVQRGHLTLAVVCLAIALATKQQMLLILPLAAWWRPFGLRRTVAAVAGAILMCLPWIVADPGAFYDDTIRFNAHLPVRPDSLSLYEFAVHHGHIFSSNVAYVAALAALTLAMWRLPRNAFGFSLGSAFVLYAFSMFNRHAFFNHYTLVLGLLVIACASAAPATVRPSTNPVAVRMAVPA